MFIFFVCFLKNTVLESAPNRDSRDFNVHIGNNSVTWRCVTGRNDQSDLKPCGVMFLDFCANPGLSIRNAMFKHKGVRNASGTRMTWTTAQ